MTNTLHGWNVQEDIFLARSRAALNSEMCVVRLGVYEIGLTNRSRRVNNKMPPSRGRKSFSLARAQKHSGKKGRRRSTQGIYIISVSWLVFFLVVVRFRLHRLNGSPRILTFALARACTRTFF